jgi:thiol-disulfide isomerase/thioredoxin
MKQLLYGFLLALGGVLNVAAQTNQDVKLTGQIVCSQCWFEADRAQVAYGTPADLDCAKTCAAKGIPASLAVKNASSEGWTLYALEDGSSKKPGKDWLPFMAKQAEISGTTRATSERSFLKVNDLRVLGDANAAANQAAEKLIGADAELALKDLFGVEQKLSAYRGRLVLVNFWATWCGPCIKEMPELAALQNEYAAFGLQVIGAAADTTENLKEVRQFIKTAKINFPSGWAQRRMGWRASA